MRLKTVSLILSFTLLLSISTGVSGQGVGSDWVKTVESVVPAVAMIQTEKAVGSGFFVKSDGTLITNNHVIAGSKEITVKLSNGETYRRAFLLSSDEQRDLAILRVEASGLPALSLANSNDSKTGARRSF